MRPDQLGSTPSLSSLPALQDLGLFQLMVLIPHRSTMNINRQGVTPCAVGAYPLLRNDIWALIRWYSSAQIPRGVANFPHVTSSSSMTRSRSGLPRVTVDHFARQMIARSVTSMHNNVAAFDECDPMYQKVSSPST